MWIKVSDENNHIIFATYLKNVRISLDYYCLPQTVLPNCYFHVLLRLYSFRGSWPPFIFSCISIKSRRYNVTYRTKKWNYSGKCKSYYTVTRRGRDARVSSNKFHFTIERFSARVVDEKFDSEISRVSKISFSFLDEIFVLIYNLLLDGPLVYYNNNNNYFVSCEIVLGCVQHANARTIIVVNNNNSIIIITRTDVCRRAPFGVRFIWEGHRGIVIA